MSRKEDMVIMILSVLSVICFCVCAHFFIRVLVTPLPSLNRSTYSRAALRVRRTYQILAWGTMTFSFLFALVLSFTQVYCEL